MSLRVCFFGLSRACHNRGGAKACEISQQASFFPLTLQGFVVNRAQTHRSHALRRTFFDSPQPSGRSSGRSSGMPERRFAPNLVIHGHHHQLA